MSDNLFRQWLYYVAACCIYDDFFIDRYIKHEEFCGLFRIMEIPGRE